MQASVPESALEVTDRILRTVEPISRLTAFVAERILPQTEAHADSCPPDPYWQVCFSICQTMGDACDFSGGDYRWNVVPANQGYNCPGSFVSCYCCG